MPGGAAQEVKISQHDSQNKNQKNDEIELPKLEFESILPTQPPILSIKDDLSQATQPSSKNKVKESIDDLDSGPLYKGYPTKSISKEEASCRKKGKIGLNRAKICTLYGNDYHMKEVAENEIDERKIMPEKKQKAIHFEQCIF